ncbi:MAG TPA: hypothetical protein VGE74_27285, partial [Gemmata sp.]
MRLRVLALLFVLCAAPAQGQAAVVVIGNYTDGTMAFKIAEPEAKAREHKLPSNHVIPVFVGGPADITFTAKGHETKLRLDMYNAYVFLPDEAAGVRLEGLELPGEPLERDTRAEVNPAPRDPPVKVPVALLVDDTDPRADKAWQAELRKRFDGAAEVIEKASGVKLTFSGFGTWKSDPVAQNTSDLLRGLEKAVKAKEGTLVVGYSSRKIDPKVDPAFGAGRGLAGRHILLREWTPKSEIERTEVLVHFLAQALGGVGSPDPGSALRSQLGNGYALREGAVIRLDPLNALVLNLWADERRREPDITMNSVAVFNRARMTRVYKALLKAAPGDSLAIVYLNDLDRDIAKDPGPAPKGPERRPVVSAVRDVRIREVLAAVRARAKQNAALGDKRLTGDELTAAYIKAAGETAVRSPSPDMVPAFLIGLGVALDDTGALADDATTWSAVQGLETPAERKERLAALGNPTLAGRRDLCRRFFLGCAVGELVPEGAEGVAVGRSLFELHRPANLCVPALAAELAGITYARAAFQDPDLLHDAVKSFTATEYLPPMNGLRDGLSAEKFEELYGGTADERFLSLLADVRKRLR